MKHDRRFALFLGTAILSIALGACAPQRDDAGSQIVAAPVSEDGDAIDPASSLHERVLVMDTHLDTPIYFHSEEYNFSKRGSFDIEGTHVDLPRMKEGGLDGGFWVIFTRQGPLDAASYAAARNSAVLRQIAIRELAAKYSDEVELAFNAADAERIHAAGKRIVYQSMENAYPLGLDLSMLETFYRGGLRMVSPVHWANNQFADAATDIRAAYNGLSPLGEDLIREANRLGLIIDPSHASDETLRDILELSTTPVILSHSGPNAIFDHPRNVPDDLLLSVAEKGGVIQINALGAYLEALEDTPARLEARAVLADAWDNGNGSLSSEEYRAARRAIDKEHPPARSSFEKFMEHLLYTLELLGPDHVGIGADWDGGGGVDGMKDITALPKITAALLDAGYSEADIAKIWGGNIIRVLEAVEAAKTANIVSPNVLQ